MLGILGKTLLKSGAKKIAKDKLLNRKKKTNKRRVSVKKIMGMEDKQKGGGEEQRGGALAIQPRMDLVPSEKDFDPVSDTSGESDIVIIRKQLIQVKDILKDSYTAKKEERDEEKKSRQTEKREKREEKLEKPKVKPQESKGMKMPNLGLGIGNFLSWLVMGLIVGKLLTLMPALKKIFSVLKPIADFIGGVFNVVMGFVVGFINTAYAGIEKLEKAIEAIGGEGAKELFEKFGKLFTQVMNGALIAALIGARVGLFKPKTPKTPKNPNNINNRVNNRRTFSNNRVRGGQLNRGPLSGIREFLRKNKPFNFNVSKGSNLFGRNLSKLNNFNNKVTTGTGGVPTVNPNVTTGTGGLPKVPSGSQGRGLGRFFKNIKLPSLQNIKNFRPSGAAVRGAATGLLKGGATMGIGMAADAIVDVTFNALDRKRVRDQINQELKKSDAEDILKMSKERLTKEYKKPIAPWWMLGLADSEGTGISKYRDQKYIILQEYGIQYLGEKSSKVVELSQTMLRDKTIKSNTRNDYNTIESNNTQSKVEGLDTHPSYAQGGMMLIENTTTYIQPVEV